MNENGHLASAHVCMCVIYMCVMYVCVHVCHVCVYMFVCTIESDVSLDVVMYVHTHCINTDI